MTEETVRPFEAGRLSTIPAPDRLERANRLRSDQKIDREQALSPVLEAEHQGVTNAVIAFGRHGEGEHIQRGTDTSQIDAKRDAAAFARVRSRGVF